MPRKAYMTKNMIRNVSARAKLCKKAHACLKSEKHLLCPVEEIVEDKIPFVKCLNPKECFYKAPFGTSLYICHCPVRLEIYHKYRV